MATVSIEVQVQERVKEIVTLLMKRPITEEIALKIGDVEGFKNLEIANGEWVGFDEDEYMTGEEHGRIEMRLLLAIGSHVEANDLGQVYPGDVDFVLSGNKKTLEEKRQPDVAFVVKSRLQKTKGYFYGAPDLAVEIVSPSQKRPEMVEKANIYFKYGTKEVWLVFPLKKEIEVHTPDKVPVVYTEKDTLTGGTFLPNFSLALAKVFKV
jgi:Uma2 family endonuclease